MCSAHTHHIIRAINDTTTALESAGSMSFPTNASEIDAMKSKTIADAFLQAETSIDVCFKSFGVSWECMILTITDVLPHLEGHI